MTEDCSGNHVVSPTPYRRAYQLKAKRFGEEQIIGVLK
jgi:hypothetical protein